MTKANTILILGTAIAAVCATPAFADRQPRPHERALIETKLRELGFTHWDEIEFDERHNAWEIDDARTNDGKEYDLRLSPLSLQEISRTVQD